MNGFMIIFNRKPVLFECNFDSVNTTNHSSTNGYIPCPHWKVPLSLAIKISSLRGTLRLYIKPPPSDQLWFAFTSMPEIAWNLDSAVGDRKITSSHVALLIGNRVKVSLVFFPFIEMPDIVSWSVYFQ